MARKKKGIPKLTPEELARRAETTRMLEERIAFRRIELQLRVQVHHPPVDQMSLGTRLCDRIRIIRRKRLSQAR